MLQVARSLPVSLIVSGSVHLGLMLILAFTAGEVAREIISVEYREVPPIEVPAVKPRAKVARGLTSQKISPVQEASDSPQVQALSESTPRGPKDASAELQISAKQIYQSQLMRELNSKKSYPAMARKLRQEGLVVVQFRVARSGQILEARVVKESPFQSLNQSARDLVKSLKGLAPLPQEISETSWLFEVPVQYQM